MSHLIIDLPPTTYHEPHQLSPPFDRGLPLQLKQTNSRQSLQVWHPNKERPLQYHHLRLQFVLD